MEYLVVILDVRSVMYDDATNFFSLNSSYSILKCLVQKKLFLESKDEVAVIFSGTNNSCNDLNVENPSAYKNISIIRELGKLDWNFFDELQQELDYHGCDNGDLLEAVIVALDHMKRKLSGRKINGRKRIVICSNLEGNVDYSDLESVIDSLKRESTEIAVISNRRLYDAAAVYGSKLESDYDEPSTSNDGANSGVGDGSNRGANSKISRLRLENEKQFLYLVNDTDGQTTSFDEALLSVNFFEPKSTAQRGWKVDLEVSDQFSLLVEGFRKINEIKLPTCTPVYGGDPDANIKVRSVAHRNGEVVDASESDMIKGFKYGQSIVPLTEEDLGSMKLSGEKSLKLIGFTEEEYVPRQLYSGNSNLVFMPANSTVIRPFAALVHAMYDMNVVALVRRVYSAASSPNLGFLCPRITAQYVALDFYQLPFGEDVRHYSFRSLPTSSNEHLRAVDELIDNMLLVSKSSSDDNDTKNTELLKPKQIHNPTYQYFYQCCSHKLSHPNEKLPEPSTFVFQTLQPYLHRSADDAVNSVIDSLKKVFVVRKQEEPVKKRKNKQANTDGNNDDNPSKKPKDDNDENDISMDLDDMFTVNAVDVGSITPIEDFANLINRGELVHAMESMQNQIIQMIKNSYLDTFYPKAVQCIKELRKQALIHSSNVNNFVSMFNRFYKQLKNDFTTSNSSLWKLIEKEDISSIDKSESEFVESDSELPSDDKESVPRDDMDDLFGDM